MELKIFYSIIVITLISIGTAFAQESLISVQTDDNNYDEGDIILISGKISTIVGVTPVTLQLFSQGNLIDIAQISVAQDGNYSHTIIAEGPLWKKEGTYIVRVLYGDGNSAETEFDYFPSSSAIGATTNFEVDAGSHGTFDVKYTIKGGTVKNMVVDPNIFALIVQIDTIDDGVITLELPREFIDAVKQDGNDEEFIILIDGMEVSYEEQPTTTSEFRTIMINFEEDDSDIEIIGTYAIPEFSSIVMMILIVGIMIMILATKNRLQITKF